MLRLSALLLAAPMEKDTSGPRGFLDDSASSCMPVALLLKRYREMYSHYRVVELRESRACKHEEPFSSHGVRRIGVTEWKEM